MTIRIRTPAPATDSRPRPPRQTGAALLIFAILLAFGALAYLVGGFAGGGVDRQRDQDSQTAMARAKEALVGYAMRYRDQELAHGNPDQVYGYLPLPDLGSSRNNNVSCGDEGCDAANFAGNVVSSTVIGRLPWRALGIDPLRDGHGECLWYAVSGSHQRIQQLSPLNWDSLPHLDIVAANGSATLGSILTSPHDRPVAVIFSAGPALPGQDRRNSTTDDVSACGGNYDVANYLDPGVAGALGGVTNYLGGTNNASAITDPGAPKALSAEGKVFASAGDLFPMSCQGNDCSLSANDLGVTVTGDELFGAIRKYAYFRTDINAMLDRMASCLRDQAAAGGFGVRSISGFSPPADKSAGRIVDSGSASTCYDDNRDPVGYFGHYKDLVFLAKPNTGRFSVNGGAPDCAGVLIFSDQRTGVQRRTTAGETNNPANYLEGMNLASFTGAGTAFQGNASFDRLPPPPLPTELDVVRCIPSSTTFTVVESPGLREEGFAQLVVYDAATRTLTLGSQDVTTGAGASADALFGCAWVSEARNLGSSLRIYFRFQFRKVGTSVGTNGFVFALADAETNSLQSCGAAGSHLGYSGTNDRTPRIASPKIGIEFDQGRNAGFNEDPLNPGRNDPCGTSICGGTAGFNSHAAMIYWGHGAPNLTDGVSLQFNDDNVHGFPTPASVAGTPWPEPRNPQYPSEGIAFVNLRGVPDDSRVYHIRLEVTQTMPAPLAPARVAAGAPVNLASPGAILDGVALAARDRVLLTAQTNPAENGVYFWVDASTPLRRTPDADEASELSLATIRIADGSVAGSDWHQPRTISSVGTDSQDWRSLPTPAAATRRYHTAVWIEGNASAADRIAAMKNTTRPMSQLDPGFQPSLGDSTTMHGVAASACTAGNCPSGQACGSDGICYSPPLQRVQLGFTTSQRTTDQEVTINDFFATTMP